MKLLTLNVEMDNHLKSVEELLVKENPDTVCLQEVFTDDIDRLRDVFKPMDVIHAPMGKSVHENPYRLALRGEYGCLLMSRHPIISSRIDYYVGDKNVIPTLDVKKPNSINRAVILADIEVNSEIFTIATTHFTWTPDGEATPLQHKNLASLFQILKQTKELVLCGDFNAPRGKEIWAQFAAQFTDNIPPEVTTTIDQNLHRHHGIQLVVDGLFTTPQYLAQNVQVIDGVSDHKAIVANVLLVKTT